LEVILLALDPALVFQATEAAYRHGVLDQSLPVLSDALEKLIDETGLTLEDLLNKLDGAQQKTVDRVDKVLSHSGPLLKLAKQDWLMKLTARMLNLAIVRKSMAFAMRKSLALVIARSEGTHESLIKKLKQRLGKGA
jgi:hypothetical protein